VYVSAMGSGDTIYIPSFRKIGSGIQEPLREGGGGIHKQQGDLLSLLLFFRSKESRLKRDITLPLNSSLKFIESDHVFYHFCS
jgi:hypothetical protein